MNYFTMPVRGTSPIVATFSDPRVPNPIYARPVFSASLIAGAFRSARAEECAGHATSAEKKRGLVYDVHNRKAR